MLFCGKSNLLFDVEVCGIINMYFIRADYERSRRLAVSVKTSKGRSVSNEKSVCTKIIQYGIECFSGVADARILAGMSQSESQDAQVRYQRSLKMKKVLEIAEYVDKEQGLIPGSVILGTRFADKVSVSELQIPSESGVDTLYYVELPETKAELAAYRETLDVMDGQHRLLAFSSDYIKIEASVKYQLPFNLYITPSLDLKRIIFMAANEKQDKVDSNLLQWYRMELGKLDGEEENYSKIIQHLNEDEDSPLFNRVIMGDEKKLKGYKAMQLIKIMQKLNLMDLQAGGNKITIDDLLYIIKIYLSAWEQACAVKFITPLVSDTTTKIAGIRYMLNILPSIWASSLAENKQFTVEFVEGKIKLLAEAVGVAAPVQLFRSRVLNFAYRGEGATIRLAQLHAEKLRAYEIQGRPTQFNPLTK